MSEPTFYCPWHGTDHIETKWIEATEGPVEELTVVGTSGKEYVCRSQTTIGRHEVAFCRECRKDAKDKAN